MKVEIWDRETWLPDDLVGEGVLNMAPILMSPPGIQTVQTVHLFYQGRGAGTLNLAIVVQGQLANSGPVVIPINYLGLYVSNVELLITVGSVPE
jgi:hypothetical protein